MTELKYLKDIAEQLKGIKRELHKHNEIMQRCFAFPSQEDLGVKDETVCNMETGQSDDV